MSKYDLLWRYLKDNNKEKYKLSYEEIKSIIGFDLDHSFLTYKKELNEFGYKVKKISMKKIYNFWKNNMKILEIINREKIVNTLVEIWEDSVIHTHLFLHIKKLKI